jgi:hypothetical protein
VEEEMIDQESYLNANVELQYHDSLAHDVMLRKRGRMMSPQISLH